MAILLALVVLPSLQQVRRAKEVFAKDASERVGVCQFRELSEASQARYTAFEVAVYLFGRDADGIPLCQDEFALGRLRDGLRFENGRVVG